MYVADPYLTVDGARQQNWMLIMEFCGILRSERSNSRIVLFERA